jgi:Cu/Ag efflux protein CusF
MKTSTSVARPFATLLLTGLVAACGGAHAPAAGPDATYAMRGEIVRLPDAEAREIWIRHEAVPDFKDADGKVVGMESMTMPFDLAPGAGIDGLAVGDRVSFRLEMRWQGASPAVVTALEKLPAGTRLAFDPAPAAGPAQPAPATGSASAPE